MPKGEPGIGGKSTGGDWFHPVDGGSSQVSRNPSNGPEAGGQSECVDGVCPVPWATKTVDVVNHPPHYTAAGTIECIEAIEAQLTTEEYRGYLKGNIAKYNWRERNKGGTESLKKAQWYLNRLIEFDEAQKG